jgi:ATP-dependent DNA helicase RecQ
VIAREWSYLDPVRSLCELLGIPVQLANEEFTGVWHLRETQALVEWLRNSDAKLITSEELLGWLDQQAPGPWNELLREACEDFALETGGTETGSDLFIEWLAEWAREVRRRQRGLLLLTAHRAKGLEFDHVFVPDGGWDRVGRDEDADAPRRLYYVAMTRARETLALARLTNSNPFHDALSGIPSVQQRNLPARLLPAQPELARSYRRLSLRDVFLSYAGYRDQHHPVHRAIANLATGDPIYLKPGPNRWQILDSSGTVVGQLARSFAPPVGMRCVSATVLAIVKWNRDNSEPEYQKGLRCDRWEVVIPELVFEPEE